MAESTMVPIETVGLGTMLNLTRDAHWTYDYKLGFGLLLTCSKSEHAVRDGAVMVRTHMANLFGTKELPSFAIENVPEFDIDAHPHYPYHLNKQVADADREKFIEDALHDIVANGAYPDHLLNAIKEHCHPHGRRTRRFDDA